MKEQYFLYVIGGHYGDEAKGKICDLLAPKFDAVVRGAGGNNAGHTIMAGNKKIALHLLPAGTLHAKPLNVLGNEMMIDLDAFAEELAVVKGWNKHPRIKIAGKANLVMDWHRAFDGASESGTKIGTTKRGIGPAAEAKYSRRWALTASDLLSADLGKKVERIVSEQRLRIIEQHPSFHHFSTLRIYDALHNDKELSSALKRYAAAQTKKLKAHAKHMGDLIVEDIGEELSSGRYKTILGEGAQGAMLDPTFGLLPYTTSTPTTVHGLSRGMGIEPSSKEALGVFKAYETRVGEGPFPTQMPTALGREIQKIGGEFGATTGRARTCGWFNLHEAKYAVRTNNLTWIAITKLDVLDKLKEIKVGLGMKNGQMAYKTFKGWQQDTTRCRTFEQLPGPAKQLLRWLESELVPIAVVSVGPDRAATIFTEPFRQHLAKHGVAP